MKRNRRSQAAVLAAGLLAATTTLGPGNLRASSFPADAVVLSDARACTPIAPTAVGLPDGGLLTAWQDDGLLLRRPLGVHLQALGRERVLRGLTPYFHPEVARGEDGEIALVWIDFASENLMATVLNAADDETPPTPFVLHALDSSEQPGVTVTAEPGGTFLAMERHGIEAVRFSSEGVVEAIPMQGGSHSALLAVDSQILQLFVFDFPTSPPTAGVFLQRRETDGTQIGFAIGLGNTSGTYSDTAWAIDENGGTVAVWSSASDGVQMQRSPEGSGIFDDPLTLSGPGTSTGAVAVASDAAGNAVVAWEANDAAMPFGARRLEARTLFQGYEPSSDVVVLADGLRDGKQDMLEFAEPAAAISGPGRATIVGSSFRPVLVTPPPCGSENLGVFAIPISLGGDHELLLQGGRFRVRVDWTDASGATHRAFARSDTQQAGSFWFFDQENTELEVKVLDGRGTNGRFWVYASALTDLAFTLTITDQHNDVVRSWDAPPGALFTLRDIEAFL